LNLTGSASTQRTVDITDNFILKPSLFGSISWFDDSLQEKSQESTSFGFSLSPKLDTHFSTHFLGTVFSLNNDFGLTYAWRNESSTNNFSWYNRFNTGLSKYYYTDSSIWQTGIGLNAYLRGESDAVGNYSLSTSILRENIDNWRFSLLSSLGYSESSLNSKNHYYNTQLYFSHLQDAGKFALATGLDLNHSSEDGTDEEQSLQTTNSRFNFSLDLHSFYAFDDLTVARASLNTYANFTVGNQYNYIHPDDILEESQTPYTERINTSASLSLESYALENWKFSASLSDGITWLENTFPKIDSTNQNNQETPYKGPNLSFSANYFSSPLYSSRNGFSPNLRLTIDSILSEPTFYGSASLSYDFNNPVLKDFVTLDANFSNRNGSQSNIQLKYNFNLPELVTWDGKYGFQEISVSSGINYNFLDQDYGLNADISFDAVLSYQWNLGFRMNIGYYNDEWSFRMF